VSHLKERKEKICLNCNASLYGRFCHVCGQENLEPKETVWHLVTHFFNDITHFDGKFFSTVKYLIIKPGFLSAEYMAGKRASYLNPIRMYVFTSAFFFLVLFSLTSPDKMMKVNEQPDITKEGIKDWEAKKARLQSQLKKVKDSSDAEDINSSLKVANQKLAAVKKVYGDTSTRKFSKKEINLLILRANMDTVKLTGTAGIVQDKINKAINTDSSAKEDELNMFNMGDYKYKTVGAYDSAQNMLPDNRKDGWLKKIFARKLIKVSEEVRRDSKGFREHFMENFLHSFPKILFFSLPFFALILKFVYIRRKSFYYADHGIFAIDVYCAVFILLLVVIILTKLDDLGPWIWYHILLGILIVATWLYMFIYLYKAMRRFYKQGRIKTF
jgi:hypothetical protein